MSVRLTVSASSRLISKDALLHTPSGWYRPGLSFAELHTCHSHSHMTYLVGFEPIHLHEQLVECLLGVALPLLAAASYRIDLVNEHDAWGLWRRRLDSRVRVEKEGKGGGLGGRMEGISGL